MHVHLELLRLRLVRERALREPPRPAKLVALEARRQARLEKARLEELPPPRPAA